jgi:hypothetical protein
LVGSVRNRQRRSQADVSSPVAIGDHPPNPATRMGGDGDEREASIWAGAATTPSVQSTPKR